MKFRKLIAMAITTACVLALSACGGGRSASGTNLVVSGTGPTTAVTAGDSVVFTMTVTNIGDHEATDIVITDGLRTANVTSITCAAQGGAICPTTLGTSMEVPTLNVGGTLVFTITGTVDAQANLPVVNTMTATIADDTDRVDNTATVQVNASTAVTNVTVTGTGPTATVTGGDSVVFTMTVANTGNQDATDLVITDGLRTANLTGITCAAQAGAVCPATLSSSMNVPLLTAGGSLVFMITGTVEAGANLPVVNTLTVTIANDTNRDDNTATVQVNASTALAPAWV